MTPITVESLKEYGFVKLNSWDDEMYFNVIDVDGVELTIIYGQSSNYGKEHLYRMFFNISEYDDFILDYKYIEQIDNLVKALTVKSE